MMAEKIKKRGPMLNLRRWNSQKVMGDKTPSPMSAALPQDTSYFRSQSISRTVASSEPRKLSADGVEELVRCALCSRVLQNPKMLPCQHTFCMACLADYIGDKLIFNCTICDTRIQVHGPNFAANLPKNLYIDSLLKIMGANIDRNKKSPEISIASPTYLSVAESLEAPGERCSGCKTLCEHSTAKPCGHCKLKFCSICWSEHTNDVRIQMKSIRKQMDNATNHLEHKVEHFKDQRDRIVQQINATAEEKISEIVVKKIEMLSEVSKIAQAATSSELALRMSLTDAKKVAEKAMESSESIVDDELMSMFMNLHNKAVQLISDVSSWDTDRLAFDKENFCLETDFETLDVESDEPVMETPKQNDPLESEDSLVLYYRSHSFVPQYVWKKTSRPSGVAVGPWNSFLYVCGMDSHSVAVIDMAEAKTVVRLTCEEMLCPVHVAFLKRLGEIYVTDKWKHCIHVFSKEGVYLRSMGQKGSRLGMLRSPEGIATDDDTEQIYVVDTGNDRVQILSPDGKFVDQLGVATKSQASTTPSLWETQEILCTELNSPTSVAVTSDRVIILDSGNRRVKVYNKQNRGKIVEFGSTGHRKGQFRQPEVLTVDPLGYILVGDSGNRRVQVFKPTGQLVRAFGKVGTQPGSFGWISGLCVTKQLHIIVSDSKNNCVNIF